MADEMSNPDLNQRVAEALDGRKKKTSPYNEIAKEIEQSMRRLIHDTRSFYRYDEEKGVWTPLLPEQMEQHVKRALGDYNHTHARTETLKNLRIDCYVDPAQLNHRKNLCNVQNGMLNLFTFELLPHDPSYFSTIQLSVKYQQDAKCPLWFRFLNEIFEGDPDAEQKISFLQEWAGYLLVPETRQQKCVICLGAGANGKGTLVGVLRGVIG